MENERLKVIKIGKYYYTNRCNANSTLELTLNIQQARWFDTSVRGVKERMTEICVDYGGERRNLIDEL